MKIGFDNDRYLAVQSEHIKERVDMFGGKLYLEFGGKLFDDYHASRVLPGFMPDSKIRMLLQMKDDVEAIVAVNAADIERNKVRGDLGITYDLEVLRLIDNFTERGIPVVGVVLTRYTAQPAVVAFEERLKALGVKAYRHYSIPGYPSDIKSIVSDEGFGKNDYVPTTKPLVVVTAPGPGSGKMAVALSQMYAEYKQGKVAGYAKFETFPVWNIPLRHPVNIAYEAATIDLGDKNMIDPYHLAAYGKTAVNYNRDVDAYPLLKAIWERMTKSACPYRSPTDMGVNRIGFGIVDDEVVRNACKQEVIRRFLRYQCLFAEAATDRASVERASSLMVSLGIRTEDRVVVEAARRSAEEAHIRGKGKAGGTIVSGAAIQLRDGRIVTGRNSDEMHAAAAMVMNAVKTLSGIPAQIPLIGPSIIRSIAHMKQDILKVGYTSLNLDEALIGLAISSTTNPAAQIAMEKLNELRGCEVHMTHMVTPGDEAGLRRLGCRYTSDPYYASNRLFTGQQ